MMLPLLQPPRRRFTGHFLKTTSNALRGNEAEDYHDVLIMQQCTTERARANSKNTTRSRSANVFTINEP